MGAIALLSRAHLHPPPSFFRREKMYTTTTPSPPPWLGRQAMAGGAGRVKLPPNDPFFLTHHPSAWELSISDDGEPEWLPQLSKLAETAGVQGVRQTKGAPDSGLARTMAMDMGKTILPQEMGYLTRYPTTRGGYHYCIKWSHPKTLAGRTMLKTDEAGWDAWRRGLVAEGILSPPDPDLIDIFIEREQRTLDRYVRSQHIPEIKLRMDEVREKMSDMKKAILAISKVKK